MIVDTREPVELADELNKSDLTVSVGHLICGDVLITDINDPRRQLVFERKRITDFTQSIIGDDRRAYKQIEKQYALQQEALANDRELHVVWIIEREEGS